MHDANETISLADHHRSIVCPHCGFPGHGQCPSPAEIQAACEIIQAGWSSTERSSRAKGRSFDGDAGDRGPTHWTAPAIRMANSPKTGRLAAMEAMQC